MKRSIVLNLLSLVVVAGGLGCMPTDNVVGGKPLSAAGTAGMDAFGGSGGTAQGGSTANPEIHRGGGAGISTIQTDGAGGTVPTPTGGVGGTMPIATGGAAGYPVGCEDYLDATTGHAIEIVIRNERSTPVYVGNRISGCSNDQTFRIYDATGAEVRVDDDPIASCTCQDYAVHGGKYCAIRSCLRSPLRRIEANSELRLRWDGLYLATREFRAECMAGGTTAISSCSQTTAAPSGHYRLAVTGNTGYACASPSDQAKCSCVETNTCSLGMISLQGAGELLEPSTEFELMSSQSVTVTFTDSMSAS